MDSWKFVFVYLHHFLNDLILPVCGFRDQPHAAESEIHTANLDLCLSSRPKYPIAHLHFLLG